MPLNIRHLMRGESRYFRTGSLSWPKSRHGLAFSVKPEVAIPPSLLNMYKELANDIPGFQMPNHGYLVKWAEQGVLLLNTSTNCRERGMAHSHAKFGWEVFTDQVIAALNEHREKIVFCFGKSCTEKRIQFIDRNRHYVLTAPILLPFCASWFLGCHHFSKTNRIFKTTWFN